MKKAPNHSCGSGLFDTVKDDDPYTKALSPVMSKPVINK